MEFIRWFLSDQVSGFFLLGLLMLQGAFIMRSPGSLRIQKPEGGAIAWVYNIFNLGFMLVLTPLVACDLLGLIHIWKFSAWASVDAFRMTGLLVYLPGCVLLCWSRVVLGRNFRLGAVRPGQENQLVTSGPFKYIRHPMYTAVILTAFGLSLISHNVFILMLAFIFTASIIAVIPIEEAQLEAAYQDSFRTWRIKTRRLLPWIY